MAESGISTRIMDRSAGEDEMAESGGAPTLTTNRKRPAIDGASSSATIVGGCDDTVGTILARLPARTAIACTALSKQHRSLIRSPEFRSLHCRLGAPLPSPHVAYLATAPIIRRRPEQADPPSGYYGFHLAGAGLTGGNGDAPIRSLARWRYLGTRYVNTCTGVLLLATNAFSSRCRCTLWNPAVADATREATVPKPENCLDREEETSSEECDKSEPIVLADGKELWYEKTQFLALGLGYGRRSNTYKLLLCRRDRCRIRMFMRDHQGKIIGHGIGGPTHHFEYLLVVHSLCGDTEDDKETLLLRTVLAMETVLSYKEVVMEDILKCKSMYMDGTIYILYSKKDPILRAFDVDDETVHTIDMPNDLQEAKYQLIATSGYRPCLVVMEQHCIALWMLTEDYQLEPIHVISYKIPNWFDRSIAGVWDCGSLLLLLLNHGSTSTPYMLLLYDVTAKKVFRANMPCGLKVQLSEYMLCWGYKPTLVSPESIIGKLNEDMARRQGRAHITEVINPLHLQDKRKGQEATLNVVCLMEFLVRIMQKLPRDLHDVLEMPKIGGSEEPGLLFQNVV